MRSCSLCVALATILHLAVPSLAAQPPYTLTGGKNAILGTYLSAGRRIPVGDITETLGLTWSEVLGIEQLAAISYSQPVGNGWTFNAGVSYGGIGGDYRVNRLPEIRFTKSAPISILPLSYSLGFGVAYYMVRPVALSGFRTDFSVQLDTTPYTVSPNATLSSGITYAYQVYDHGGPDSGAWGSVTLTLTHSPSLSTSFTYFREITAGTSPLLFDNLTESNYVLGLVSLVVSPGFTVQHSQEYSFLSNSLIDRIYSVIVTTQPDFVAPWLVNVSLGYDDIAQKWSLSAAFAR